MTDTDDRQEQALFPIRTVVAETGVNAITLRAWERRYGLISPVRTPSGHRLYSQADIDLVRRIMALQDKGIPVSRAIAWLKQNPDDPLPDSPPRRAEATPAGDGPTSWAALRERMLDAVSRLDDYDLETAWQDAVDQYPVDAVLGFLLVPVGQQLRDGDDTPARRATRAFYEAFLRNRLGTRFANQSREAQGAKVALAGDAAGKTARLRIGIALAQQGLRPVLFSGDLSAADLAAAAQAGRLKAFVVVADDWSAAGTATLAQLAREGLPVFAGGDGADSAAGALRAAGAITLPEDPAGAARLVRDVLAGG